MILAYYYNNSIVSNKILDGKTGSRFGLSEEKFKHSWSAWLESVTKTLLEYYKKELKLEALQFKADGYRVGGSCTWNEFKLERFIGECGSLPKIWKIH